MRAKEFLLERTKYITLNRRLNPKLWKDGKMDLQVIEKLKKIAGAFEDFIGIDLNVVDVTVTGSNANYTWTEHSDLDLHLIVKGYLVKVLVNCLMLKKLFGQNSITSL